VLNNHALRGIWVGITTTLRQLRVGGEFALFPTYRDKTLRPRLFFQARGPSTQTSSNTLYQTGTVRLRQHVLRHCSVEIEVTRPPVNLRGTLRVVEHRPNAVTLVADKHGRIAPLWSGIRLRSQPQPRRAR
jgi:hypothetical protein